MLGNNSTELCCGKFLQLQTVGLTNVSIVFNWTYSFAEKRFLSILMQYLDDLIVMKDFHNILL